jgi:YHS domain-containing protein
MSGRKYILKREFLYMSHKQHFSSNQNSNTHTDPVCGMTVEPAKAAKRMDYHGDTYFFCSFSCHDKFHKNPKQYLDQSEDSKIDNKSHADFYTCQCTQKYNKIIQEIAPNAVWHWNTQNYPNQMEKIKNSKV